MVSYEDALKRTLELVDLSRGRVGLRIAGITIEINSDEQEKYVKFWKEQDIRADMNACHGRGGNLKDLDIYELKTSGLDSGRCGLFQFHTFVTWEAEVIACCHNIIGATRIGNMEFYSSSTTSSLKVPNGPRTFIESSSSIIFLSGMRILILPLIVLKGDFESPTLSVLPNILALFNCS